MTGKLYIVPTPIGNLEDTTLRAIAILKQVSFIGAEDTRHARIFLQKYEITTPLFSYHKYNEKERIAFFLNKLKNGEEGAIISDAGTPGISDPAAVIIRACIQSEIPLETLPGATAFVPALVNSGLNTERFYFVGFLPAKSSAKKEILKRLKTFPDTLLFYEAPHRLESFLNLLYQEFGNRRVVIAREISKLYETYYRSTLENLTSHFEQIKLKGEFTVVVEGFTVKQLNDEDIYSKLQELMDAGIDKKRVIQIMKEKYDLPKNKIYEMILKVVDRK
jgi:16S rRNA (cytidine1402-2'-O)-methyltransferase